MCHISSNQKADLFKDQPFDYIELLILINYYLLCTLLRAIKIATAATTITAPIM